MPGGMPCLPMWQRLWVSGQVERLADGVCLAATRLDRGDGARRLEALQALHRDAVREKG